MDRKIADDINDMDKEDVKDLMNKERILLDEKTKNRIKNKTIKQIKTKKTKVKKQKMAYVAAALLICFFAISIIGFDTVIMAVNKAFGFIPGVGPIESEDLVLTLKEGEFEKENSEYKIKVESVFAKNGYIHVDLYVEDNYLQKEDSKEQLKIFSHSPKIVLRVKDKEYNMSNYSWGQGSGSLIIQGIFDVDDKLIDEGVEYTLVYNSSLEIDFRLFEISSYDNLDEIGPNIEILDFSLVAKSIVSDESVRVTLYPLYFGDYKVSSYITDEYNKYLTKDIYLDTGAKKHDYYYEKKGHFGPYNEFLFEDVEITQDMKIVIPHLEVETKESKNIKLPVPEMDTEKKIDKKLYFEDSIVTIKTVKKVIKENEHSGVKYEALKIDLEFENTNDQLKLNWLYLDDDKRSSGFSWDFDDKGRASTYYYSLDKYESGDKIKMQFKNPTYIYSNEIKILVE